MKNDKVTEFQTILRERGVEVEKLAVLAVGGEQMFGEATLLDSGVDVKNPKRFLRMQSFNENNFRVDFLLIDWDLMTNGKVFTRPDFVYFLQDLDEESQARYLGVYVNYLEQKKRESAAAANIIIPDMKTPPLGRMRPLK